MFCILMRRLATTFSCDILQWREPHRLLILGPLMDVSVRVARTPKTLQLCESEFVTDTSDTVIRLRRHYTGNHVVHDHLVHFID